MIDCPLIPLQGVNWFLQGTGRRLLC